MRLYPRRCVLLATLALAAGLILDTLTSYFLVPTNREGDVLLRYTETVYGKVLAIGLMDASHLFLYGLPLLIGWYLAKGQVRGWRPVTAILLTLPALVMGYAHFYAGVSNLVYFW